MDKIIINGGRPLSGTVRVEGAKNSALKLMAATILAPGVNVIDNVPDISDVAVMCRVLETLGARIERSGHRLAIDTAGIDSFETPYELVAQMRASISVLGPLVARFGRAKVAMPGGCRIGSRSVDIHVSGLAALGATFAVDHGYIVAEAPDGLKGTDFILDFPSVGATENLMMAAVLATGTTVVENAAREPEIVDLANMLVAMGARIVGAGTPTVVVEGVERLTPVVHSTVGDRIEAGTYLVAGAMTGGPVRVEGFDPTHLEMTIAKLRRAGCDIVTGDDWAEVSRRGPVSPVDIQTLPHPGFPTDMQAQFMALLSLADGRSVITENVFENRFMFADEIVRMGADIRIEGHHALVEGVPELSGAPVRSTDLRGGAALVLAGLVASGETAVGDVEHIDRGYERYVEKLASLGADIRRATDAGGC